MNMLDSTGEDYHIKLHIRNKADNFYGVLSLCMKQTGAELFGLTLMHGHQDQRHFLEVIMGII
jgi:hypothetical protein